jgi:predicted RNA methylase
MSYTATYSPEDNKLRFYASNRLDKDLYNRVKAAGFSWAPRQELFVAPMWTPSREDLLLELCGEIDDEDTSLVDRAEDRSDRFSEYSGKRVEDAARAHKAVEAITEHIPLGQPILIGHHSERRARKDAQKIQDGMRRAVKMWDTAQYWTDRAAGALRHAKYKELPAVRARRIKTLEADKRKRERQKQEAEMWMKLWADCAAEQDKELQAKVALRIAGMCNLSLPRKEGDREDFTQCPTAYNAVTGSFPNLYAPRTLDEVFAVAASTYPRQLEYVGRWLSHLQNRIAYERAMLAESGGTVADKTGPQKGGACRCWASPRNGGWSYVQKVNKVSVTVLDNWGNGSNNFTRTILFDKLSGVMTAAEVADKKATGELIDTEDGTGFYLRLASTTPTTAPEEDDAPAVEPENGGAEERPSIREDIAAMRDTLRTGLQIVAAPQLFPTPAHIAARMVELAEIQPGQEVLEPSAGTGVLCKAITTVEPTARVFAVELNHRLCELLSKTINRPEDAAQGICKNVLQGDFLACEGLGTFERIVMNPPFANGDDIRHITHALRCLTPGGRLVALCANGPRQNDQLRPLVEARGGLWEELPPDTFSPTGTNVRTGLLSSSN